MNEFLASPNKDLCTTDAEDGTDMIVTIVEEVLNNTVDPNTLVT